MKRQFVPIALLLFSVFVAISALQAQEQYDDLYYNPNTDHDHFYGSTVDFKKSELENKDLNSRNQDDSYTLDDDADHNDYFYSSRIRRFHRPSRYYHYDMWNSPWNYDPWFGTSSISIYNNYYGNNWNTPSFGCNSWYGGGYGGWNTWGNYYTVNNYYGNGWYGNNWYPNYYNNGWYGNNWYPNYYNNGWYNPYHGNGWNNNGGWSNGNNGSSGGTKNPKGTYYGPRQTGGASTPVPPVKYGREATTEQGTTTGRTPRATHNPEAVNPATHEGITPSNGIRGRNTTIQNTDVNENSAQGSNSERATSGWKSRREEASPRENENNAVKNNRNQYRSEERETRTQERANRSNETESRRESRSYNPPARSNNESSSRSSNDWNSSRSNNSSSNNGNSTKSSSSGSNNSSSGGRRGRD